MRRIYPTSLILNDRFITHVVIDPHYEQKHRESINDTIILDLVALLHGSKFTPKAMTHEGFEYYAEDDFYLAGKRYRLVWLLPAWDTYIGVINAFRRPS